MIRLTRFINDNGVYHSTTYERLVNDINTGKYNHYDVNLGIKAEFKYIKCGLLIGTFYKVSK